MTGAAAFTLYVGFAIGVLYLMQYTGELLDAVFVRLAAILFMAAGFVTASGWFGELTERLFTETTSTGDAVARTAFGSAIMYLIWFFLAVLWLLCLLPERWFSKAIPDWLSIVGLLIPSGLKIVPDPANDYLTGIITTITDVVTIPVRELFGG